MDFLVVIYQSILFEDVTNPASSWIDDISQSAFLHFNVNFFLDRQFRIDLTWDIATPFFLCLQFK